MYFITCHYVLLLQVASRGPFFPPRMLDPPFGWAFRGRTLLIKRKIDCPESCEAWFRFVTRIALFGLIICNKDDDDYAVAIALALEKQFGEPELPDVNKFL